MAPMKLLSWLRGLDSARRNRRYAPQVTAFEAALARLAPGDVAIDAGANVGKFTVMMARTGATVHAFEPNSVAYAQLVAAVADYPNVTTHHAALAPEAGEVKLFMHKRADEDPLLRSVSSSVVTDKSNISTEHYETVVGIDIVQFIRGLGRPLRLLKMDVEGAEVALLNRLIDEGLHEDIEAAFVEVHDRRVKSLRGPTRALRDRLRAVGATHFNLDWR